MFVVGAIARTSAASDTHTPADAARAPFGDTYTITGIFEASSAFTIFRIASDNGPHTMTELVEASRRAGIAVASLSVQSTTLDDVFTHYTGRQLRDELQDAKLDISFMYRRGRN